MPPTARKEIAPGTRRVRLALPPCGDEPGVVEIHNGDKVSEYLLFVLSPGPVGRAYRLKQYTQPRAGAEYHVLLGHDSADSICDCPDALYRGIGCKHVGMLRALLAKNLIP